MLSPKIDRSYIDYSGGENVDAALDNLADNELMKAENIDLNQRGGFSYRKGCTALNAVSYGAQVEQLVEWLKNDGTTQLMAVIGSTMNKVDVDGIATPIQNLAAATKCFHFAFQDKWYFGDGTEYYVYDGTTCAAVTPASGSDLTAIKRCKYAVWHPKSYRFLFAGDSQNKTALYYSEANEPNNVKVTSILFPTHGMGDITGLKVFGDAVIVFYKYGARIWRGIDPATDVIWDEIPIPQGTISNDSAVLTPSSLTYPGTGGLFSLTPSILNYTITLQAGQDLIPNLAQGRQVTTITSISRPDLTCAVFDPADGKYMLAYTDTVGTSRNTKVLVYFWGINGFTRYIGWQVNDWCLRANGDLLFASNGYIYKAKSGLNDAGVPFNVVVHTKKYSLDTPDNIKRCGKVFINAAQQDNPSLVTIQVCSETTAATFSNVDLNENVKWQGIWRGKWGGAELNKRELRITPKLKGSRLQIKYTQTVSGQEATIYGHTFEYKVKKPKGKRVNQDGIA